MKKASILLLLLFLGTAFTGFSHAPAPADFFAGKWEIQLKGTPYGDIKFYTNLVRKDGNLTGELVNPEDPANGKRPITKVVESPNKISIFFDSSQGGEISIDLTKVDEDNLKGALMDFDASAVRLK